jgi:Ran GTPase-activating protein (RanGAP) involved in mRNA processing and transport
MGSMPAIHTSVQGPLGDEDRRKQYSIHEEPHESISQQKLSSLSQMLLNSRHFKTLNIHGSLICTEGDSQTLKTFLASSSSLTELRLRKCGLSDALFQAIAEGLVQSSSVQSVDLSGNKLVVEAHSIADMLLQNPNLTALNLSYNKISEVGCSVIGKRLEHSASILQLSLRWNAITLASSAAFVQALSSNTNLRVLDLGHNKIQGQGVAALAGCLSTNSSLVHLDLSGNDCRQQEAGEALGKMLQLNSTLQTLILQEAHVQGLSATAIGKALGSNVGLTHLDLANNKLTEAEFEALGCGLRSNTSLHSLHMAGVISTEPLDQLLEHPHYLDAFAHALALSSSLQLLDFSNNYFCRLSKAMASALSQNSSLTSLDIAQGSLSGMHMWDVAHAVVTNVRLQELTLGLRDDQDTQKAVASIVAGNTVLKSLSIQAEMHSHHKMFLPKARVPRLIYVLGALEHNTTLTTLQIPFDVRSTLSWHALVSALRTNKHLTSLHIKFSHRSALESQHHDALLAVAVVLHDAPRYHPINFHGCMPLASITHTLEIHDMLPAIIGRAARRDNHQEDHCGSGDGDDNGCHSAASRARAWSNDSIADYLQSRHVRKVMAFTMGMHARLGMHSAVSMLNQDGMHAILSSYFMVPLPCLH